MVMLNTIQQSNTPVVCYSSYKLRDINIILCLWIGIIQGAFNRQHRLTHIDQNNTKPMHWSPSIFEFVLLNFWNHED